MELRHLDTLLAIAEEGSFTAAADALATVQSNVSDQVRQLEAELGVPLLVRSRKGAEPTEFGARSCSTARVVSTASSRRCAPTSRCCRGSTRATRASVWSAPRVAGWFPRWSPTCATRAPGVRLRVNEGASERLFAEVVDGELAQAVVTEPVDDRRLVVEHLLDEELVGLVGRDVELPPRAGAAGGVRQVPAGAAAGPATRCASRSTRAAEAIGLTPDRAGRGRRHPAHRRPRGGRQLRVDPPRDRDPARAAARARRSPSPGCRRAGWRW